MAEVKPKIVYFPARGRAELARLVLATAGVEWEEENVSGETLPALKESGKLAFGQVPLYEEGDFHLVQSNTIARYLARKHGLYGDAKQGAIADLVIDGWNDVVNKLVPLLYPTKNEEGYAAFAKDVMPGKIADFEKIAAGVAESDSITFADLALYLIAEGVEDQGWVPKEDIPKLWALKERVAANANVAAYLSSEKRYPTRKY